MKKPGITDLPLIRHTPARWAHRVLEDIPALLNDHAHLEKKAAANALELLLCWPEPIAPKAWVRTMTAVARDEVSHLATVVRIMEKRGKSISKSHASAYAAGLRKLVRRGEGPAELADRLMVSALIEARSCERFHLLAEATTGVEPDLAKLYHSLWSSEHGHYRVFLDMAQQVVGLKKIDSRWHELLKSESELVTSLTDQISMHSWV